MSERSAKGARRAAGLVARTVGAVVVAGAMIALIGWSLIERLASEGVLVPVPGRVASGANGLALRAGQALDRGDGATARQLATRSLRREPLNQTALRVLGLAELQRGRPDAALALLREGGTLGWRDVPTQLLWAGISAQAGDDRVQAERLDAVMRTSKGTDADAIARLAKLEATPGGRAALIERMRLPTAWAAVYLTRVEGLSPAALDARVATVAAARRAGVALDRRVLDRLAWALYERERPDLAHAVSQGAGSPGAGGNAPVADGSFDRAGFDRAGFERADATATSSPFDWTFTAAAGLDILVDRAPAPLSGRALHIVSNSSVALPFAQTIVRLTPGAYRLSMRTSGTKGTTPLLVGLACQFPAEPLPLVVDPAQGGTIAARFTAPPRANCGYAQLTLAVSGDEGRRAADFWLDDVQVSPAR